MAPQRIPMDLGYDLLGYEVATEVHVGTPVAMDHARSSHGHDPQGLPWARRRAMRGEGSCPRTTASLAPNVPVLASGGIFKSAAVEVLRRERRLMPTGEICR